MLTMELKFCRSLNDLDCLCLLVIVQLYGKSLESPDQIDPNLQCDRLHHMVLFVFPEVFFSGKQSGTDQTPSLEDRPHRTQGPGHN